MGHWHDQLEEIFTRAVAIESETRRREFLREACGEDSQLLREVEELLDAFAAAGSFLTGPVQLSTADFSDRFRASIPTPIQSRAAVLSQLRPASGAHGLGSIDHYQVSCVLGQGAMGVVLKAWDTKLARYVALKVLAPHLAVDPTHRKRFLREARAMAAIKHDNVASIFSIEDRKTGPYIVMECVVGESLETRLRRKEPFQVPDIITIARQLASGLAAAHQKGIIHRDIKPSNIMMEVETGRVVILDFGLVMSRWSGEHGELAGTPAYMSPEQWARRPLDERSDLFSLGAVLYTLCTGEPPFAAANSRRLLERLEYECATPILVRRPDLPPEFARLIDRLLERDPDKRPPSADIVHLALERLPSLMPMHRRILAYLHDRKSSAGLQLVSVVLGIALLGTAALGAWRWSQPAPSAASAEANSVAFNLYGNHRSFLVFSQNAVCADELDNCRYWRPAVAGEWGEVIYRVRFDRDIRTCRLFAKAMVWHQYDPEARAQLYVSLDKKQWHQFYDTGTHGNGTQCNIDGYEVTRLEPRIRGQREFYVKARLYSRDAESADLQIQGVVDDKRGHSVRIGPAYAQFLRSGRIHRHRETPFSAEATFE